MEELDHLQKEPTIHPSAFVAPSADLIGNVHIGARSSIWYQCVLRGDINAIEIGEDSNVQDGSIVHLSSTFPAVIGDRVSCGHQTMIHACRIGDDVLVGMGATIMDGAEIGRFTIIGARSLVTKGSVFPEGVLVLGTPAKVVRDLTPDERESIPALAAKYVKVAAAHAARLQRD